MTPLSMLEVKNAVRLLPTTEFAAFAEWFDAYEQERWEAQIASDRRTSPALLAVVEEAKSEYRGGRCAKL